MARLGIVRNGLSIMVEAKEPEVVLPIVEKAIRRKMEQLNGRCPVCGGKGVVYGIAESGAYPTTTCHGKGWVGDGKDEL